jgi:hypothetical protein
MCEECCKPVQDDGSGIWFVILLGLFIGGCVI